MSSHILYMSRAIDYKQKIYKKKKKESIPHRKKHSYSFRNKCTCNGTSFLENGPLPASLCQLKKKKASAHQGALTPTSPAGRQGTVLSSGATAVVGPLCGSGHGETGPFAPRPPLAVSVAPGSGSFDAAEPLTTPAGASLGPDSCRPLSPYRSQGRPWPIFRCYCTQPGRRLDWTAQDFVSSSCVCKVTLGIISMSIQNVGTLLRCPLVRASRRYQGACHRRNLHKECIWQTQ